MRWDSKTSRRALVSKSAKIGLGASLGGIGSVATRVPTVAAANPEETWTKKASEEYTSSGWNRGVYLTTTVGWYGATYESEVGSWGHDFRVESTIGGRTADSDHNSLDIIDLHSLGVTADDLDRLDTAVTDEHHGVWPSDLTDSYDHSDLIIDISEIVVGAMNPWVGFALGFKEIAEELTPWNGEQSNSSYAHYDEWDYPDYYPSDAGHYRWYEAYCGSDESIFDIVAGAEDGGFGLEPSNDFTFHIQSDYTPTEGQYQSSTVKTTSVGTELFRPKQGWLVERIPYSKIRSRGKQLHWPRRRIENLLDNAGQPAFFAHKAPVHLIE